MSRAKGPAAALKVIMQLINKDIRRIKTLDREVHLRPADANTLVKYGIFLRDMQEVQERQKKEFQKELGKMSTEELIAMYEKNKVKK